jgi:hypothetical protein
VIISVLLTSTKTAAAKTNCSDVLTKCSEAVEDCQKTVESKNTEISLCRIALVQSEEKRVETYLQLQTAEDKLRSPIRNPFIMITFGVVLGLVVGGISK